MKVCCKMPLLRISRLNRNRANAAKEVNISKKDKCKKKWEF